MQKQAYLGFLLITQDMLKGEDLLTPGDYGSPTTERVAGLNLGRARILEVNRDNL